ncbi:MAG: hypothetical protein ACO3G4_16485 [Opitutaceae bacterium]
MTTTFLQDLLLLTIAAQDHADGARGADLVGVPVYTEFVAADLARHPAVGSLQAAGGVITSAQRAGLVSVSGDTIRITSAAVPALAAAEEWRADRPPVIIADDLELED